MPTFGEFETYGEPLSVTDERGHVSTVWQARKAGGDNRLFVIKVYAPRLSAAAAGQPEDALEKDRALEFLDGVKQIKKVQSEGGGNLAPIYDLGKTAAEAWYVTDHYPRNNLKAWVARRGGVDSAALRHVVQSVVAACLALKRSRGFSHGNLKPSNVFLVGQPRPLKKTPLVLTDAFPAAPLQLAGLELGDKAQVGELLGKVAEVQDLRNLGELILQLVEGRLLTRSDDYNYPVRRSSIWDILGKDADYWLKLCNQLVNPQLSLDTVNLESLAKEFRPSQLPRQLAIGAGVLVGICLLGGGVYYGIAKVRHTAGQHRVELQQKYSDAMQQARDAISRQDYSGALSATATALQIKSGDPDATQLKTDAQGKLDELAFGTAMNDGQAALQQRDYSNALAKARLALQLRAGAPAAVKLKDDAETGLKAQLTRNELEKTIAAALTAETGADWPNAGRHWKHANDLGGTDASISTGLEFSTALIRAREKLALATTNVTVGPMEAQLATNTCGQILAELPRPTLWIGNQPRLSALGALTNEVATLWRRADDLIRSAALSAAEKQRKYENATNAAMTALLRQDFGEATNQAALALLAKPKDPGATRILSNAQQAAEKAGMEAAQRAQALQNATNAALTAFAQGKYSDATNQAALALSLHPGDPVATKVMDDSKSRIAEQASMAEQNERNYRSATNSAIRALAQSKWEEATNQAGIALIYKPSDRVAQDIKAAGQKGIETAAALARENDRKYATATNAAGSLYASGKYSDATNQAYAALALRTNDAFALSLISRANEQITLATRAAADQENRFERATNLAGSALAGRNFTEATNQATLALTIRANDPTARGIIAAAQAALDAAAMTARQQEQRFSEATNGAGAALAKGNYLQASNQVQIALGIRSNDPVALSLKARAEQGLDATAAQAYVDSGNYAPALQICAKYNNRAPFGDLAQTAQTEQRALTNATRLASGGDYSFIDDLKKQRYSAKPAFATFLAKADSERVMLDGLRQLKSSSNWTAIRARFAEPTSAALLDKKPFTDLRDWANAQYAGEQQDLNQARQAFEQCDFNKVEQIAVARSGSTDFQTLAAQAKNQSALLAKLQSMTNNWASFSQAWSGLEDAVKRKPCFAPLGTWQANNNPCVKLVGQLEFYEVLLGTRRKSADVVDPRTGKPAEKVKGDLGSPDAWHKNVDNLRTALGSCSIDKKDERLKALDRAIDNW